MSTEKAGLSEERGFSVPRIDVSHNCRGHCIFMEALVSLLWTFLSTLAVGVLTIASFVIFEVVVQPTSARRQEVANVVWILAGLTVVVLWVWHSFRRRRAK